MPLNVQNIQETLRFKSSRDTADVSVIFLAETKTLEDQTMTVTLDLSDESMRLLQKNVDFLIGIFSYYRSLVERFDLSEESSASVKLKAAYKQYNTIHSWLPRMLSSVLTEKLEWTTGHDQLWQCLDENSKKIATQVLREKCAHLSVLPVYQLRSQSVTRLLEKLQNNRNSLDGAEIRILESYFEDTVFYPSLAEGSVETEELKAMQSAQEFLFWGWFALVFKSPGERPVSENRDFQTRLQNMFLNSRSPEERFERISRILKSSFVTTSVMQWICQESVRRFSGHSFTEIMKADISALEEAAKAKIQLENMVRSKIGSLKSWFDKWIDYCERYWTMGAIIEPQVIVFNPISSFMGTRVSVYGEASQENTSYLERGLTTLVDTVSHTYIKVYSWAHLATYLPPGSGNAIAIRAFSQTTQFWISRNITQYIPQVLFGASVLQASIAYTLATAALGQRNRVYYHYSRWKNEESPYKAFKEILWRNISEKLMLWLVRDLTTETLFDTFTHEARQAQDQMSLHLGRFTLLNSILITGAREFDGFIEEENNRLASIRTKLSATVEVAKELWNISVESETIASIVADQPAICFSRKALPLTPVQNPPERAVSQKK